MQTTNIQRCLITFGFVWFLFASTSYSFEEAAILKPLLLAISKDPTKLATVRPPTEAMHQVQGRFVDMRSNTTDEALLSFLHTTWKRQRSSAGVISPFFLGALSERALYDLAEKHQVVSLEPGSATESSVLNLFAKENTEAQIILQTEGWLSETRNVGDDHRIRPVRILMDQMRIPVFVQVLLSHLITPLLVCDPSMITDETLEGLPPKLRTFYSEIKSGTKKIEGILEEPIETRDVLWRHIPEPLRKDLVVLLLEPESFQTIRDAKQATTAFHKALALAESPSEQLGIIGLFAYSVRRFFTRHFGARQDRDISYAISRISTGRDLSPVTALGFAQWIRAIEEAYFALMENTEQGLRASLPGLKGEQFAFSQFGLEPERIRHLVQTDLKTIERTLFTIAEAQKGSR